jgi:hypothetical protein
MFPNREKSVSLTSTPAAMVKVAPSATSTPPEYEYGTDVFDHVVLTVIRKEAALTRSSKGTTTAVVAKKAKSVAMTALGALK